MSGTYHEGFGGFPGEALRDDVSRAALPRIEKNRLTVWRPGAREAPTFIVGEASRCVQQSAVTLIEPRHIDVDVTHVAFEGDTLSIR